MRDIIDSHQLNALVLTDTWFKDTDHAAITHDMLPTDYRVLHRFRTVGNAGGVAVVYHRDLQLSEVELVSTKPVDPTVQSESFECLVVKLISRRRRRLNIAAVKRLPTISV